MTPWTVAHQAPLSMGFPSQEYWNGLPFPSPGDLPDPKIKPISLVFFALQVDSLPTEPSGKSCFKYVYIYVNPNLLICRAGFLMFSYAVDCFDRLMEAMESSQNNNLNK